MAATATSLLRPLVTNATSKHTASLIVLHGSGDSGHGIMSWFSALLDAADEQFTFPHINVIYPSAPVRQYSANGGIQMPVWFDRKKISIESEEDFTSCTEMCHNINHLVQDEVKKGIPLNRIMVGGFSMGGGLALQYGLRLERRLAGIFALSSFLGINSCVYEALEQNKSPCPQLYQAHGSNDSLVLYDWGKTTFEKLTSLNVPGHFLTYNGLSHDMNTEEIVKLMQWITERIPEDEL